MATRGLGLRAIPPTRSEAVELRKEVGPGPEPLDGDICGLTFMNRGDDAVGLPAVYCDTIRAISLLQAELLQRVAPTEVRFEERLSEVSWQDVLCNGGNLNGT